MPMQRQLQSGAKMGPGRVCIPKVKEKDTALEGYQFFMKTEAKDLLAPPSCLFARSKDLFAA